MPNYAAKPSSPRAYQAGGGPTFWALMDGPRRDGSGGTGDVADLKGRYRAGVRSSGCTWATGPKGKCLSFAGADSAVFSGFATPSGSYSFTLRFNASGYGSNAALVESAGCWRVIFNAGNSNTLLFDVEFASGINSTAPPSLGAWHFVAVVYDDGAGQCRISVDGGGFASAATAASRTGGASLTLGNGSALTSPFTGLIDDARFYSRALTIAEVAREYADPFWRLRPPTPAALAAAAATAPSPGSLRRRRGAGWWRGRPN